MLWATSHGRPVRDGEFGGNVTRRVWLRSGTPNSERDARAPKRDENLRHGAMSVSRRENSFRAPGSAYRSLPLFRYRHLSRSSECSISRRPLRTKQRGTQADRGGEITKQRTAFVIMGDTMQYH